MTKIILLTISIGLLSCTQAGCAPPPPATQPTAGRAIETPRVVNPRVATDRSIDCTSIDRILAGLIQPGMTDEQKVLACFHWVRRVIYHGDGPRDLAYDFHRMVHVLGHGSCLRQTTPLAVLLERLGFASRSWTHDGHHMMEVNYGGAWHCLDPHMCFYVHDRSQPRQIASVEQLRADATLAADALKQGRACPGYLQCGDSPAVFGPKGNWVQERGWPKERIDEPFGRIALPRGMTYSRTWMPDEHWFKRGSWMPDAGPFHTCGVRRDSLDAVNWPLYEPHVALCGRPGKQYPAARHWGAGTILYRPSLSTDRCRDAMVSSGNVQPTAAGLASVDPSRPAEVVFQIGCPYVLSAGDLTLRTAADVQASVSVDAGKTWTAWPLAVEQAGAASGRLVEPLNGSFDGCRVKLAWTGAAPLAGLELTLHFQLNPYALPYLVPGRNVVSVGAERFGSPLTVCWDYADGPEWKQVKSAGQVFDKPGRFVIDVEGEKHPRNVSLTLSVEP